MGSLCQTCQQKVIPFRYSPVAGQPDEYAIVGEFPGKAEVQMSMPFVGRSGNVLRQELARIEIDIDDLGLGNLWQHFKNDNQKCKDRGFGALLKALQPYPQVLLLGSECSQAFFNENVTDISGLWLESRLLPGKKVMATLNPASLLMGGGIGEFRLALELFFGKQRKKAKWQSDLLKQMAKN